MSLPDKIKANVHSQYAASISKWQTVRDSLEGETAIKAANTRYLPMPSAMAKAGSTAPMEWAENEAFSHDKHTNIAYAAYKMRSRFPEFTDATLRGIIGLIQRNPSAYEALPYADFEKDSTPDGKSLLELELQLNIEVMSMGRVGLLVDVDDEGKPKLVVYQAEDILNWQTEGNNEDLRYTGVLLRDRSVNSDFWAAEPSVERHLLLYINDDGFYEIGIYEKKELIEVRRPSFMGKMLNKIPFIAIGTIDLTPDVDSPPLWPLSNLAVNIYQVIADLRNAQYMSCNPMLTISGIDSDESPSAIGSTLALVLSNEMAKAYYPKTDTTALDHVRMYIKDMQSEAIRMGANLLGNENTLAESGEAIRLRQSMAAATVASVVSATGSGLQRTINWVCEWMSIIEKASVLVNKEFSSFQMTANEQIALVQSWQAGILSSETTLENFRRAGMLQEGEDPSKEIERLSADTYRLKALAASEPDKDLKGPKGGVPEGSQPDSRVQ